MPYLLFCQCVHSYHLHKCWNCTAVWYSCQLAAKMSCSLCYDAGKVSVVTRTVNMMIARIVTLSKKVIAIFFFICQIISFNIGWHCQLDSTFNHMWWCAQLNQNNQMLWWQGNSLSYWKHCHWHTAPWWPRHVSECVLSTSSQQCASVVTMISQQNTA